MAEGPKVETTASWPSGAEIKNGTDSKSSSTDLTEDGREVLLPDREKTVTLKPALANPSWMDEPTAPPAYEDSRVGIVVGPKHEREGKSLMQGSRQLERRS